MSYAILPIKPPAHTLHLAVFAELISTVQTVCSSDSIPAESAWLLMAEQQIGQQELVTAPSNALPRTAPKGTSQLATRIVCHVTESTT